jgi:type I site-specific restriction-modification system R (restriction) subunit
MMNAKKKQVEEHNFSEGLENLISQEEVDRLLRISDFISETNEASKSLADEIKEAILDSGRLSLVEWKSLRQRLAEIEELIPHIDLLVKLKTEAEEN